MDKIGNNPQDVLNIVKSSIRDLNTTNMNCVVLKIIALPVKTVELLEEITDLIYNQALMRRNFTVLYAQLCVNLINDPMFNKLENSTITFKKMLAGKCHEVFTSYETYQQDLEKLKKKFLQNNQTLTMCITTLCRFQFDYNNKVLSNCKFISELFKQGAFSKKIILVCITELSKKKDDLHIHCLCVVLKLVGQQLSKIYNLDDTIKLILLFKNEYNNKISSTLNLLILELKNLHINNWINKELVQLAEINHLRYQDLPMQQIKEYEVKSYYIMAERIFYVCHDVLMNFVNKKVIDEVTHLLTNTWIQNDCVSFVITMICVAINESKNIRYDAGKLLHYLVMKNLVSKCSVEIGVNKVLNDWSIKIDFPNLADLVSDITREFKF